MPVRYAIYFTPPADAPLTRAASHWLGRDAFTGEDSPQPSVTGFTPERLAELTADPRRYGFHATLKAPFHLHDTKSEADLLEAFAAFCGKTAAFNIPSVIVSQIGPFFALVPDQTYTALQDFAASVVRHFEPFRAPLSEADMARRKPEKLNDSQRAHLLQWGYPYVFDDFRFHMTLTGPVTPEDSPAMQAELNGRFADITHQPLAITGLGLFIEDSRGAPFTVHSWLPLSGS
nr:DUF1045 domain-containing protein [Allorhizobium sonneratiae]